MRFLALLLLGPWLLVLGWLYWWHARRGGSEHARFDILVLVAAALAAIACAEAAYAITYGIAGPIWKQVAAALAAYAGFSVVLCVGLLRHAWLRRRRAGARA